MDRISPVSPVGGRKTHDLVNSETELSTPYLVDRLDQCTDPLRREERTEVSSTMF
jgi:hypothetical protein